MAMSPPSGGKKPALTVAIGMKPGAGKMPPPGAPPAGADPSQGGKMQQKDAICISAKAIPGLPPDTSCGMCSNYSNGECNVVDGQFDPDDRCLLQFQTASGEPDDDDMGGPPDQDGDDSGAQGPPPGMGL